MPTFRTPLTNLKRAVDCWPSAAAFKIPIIENSVDIAGYSEVTYEEFYKGVEKAASYWRNKLSGDGVPAGSVVGVCLLGYTYTDVLHVYGLMMAEYIPQTFTLFPSAIEALNTLLKSSGAQALIYQEGHFDRVKSWISTHTTLKLYPAISAFPEPESDSNPPLPGLSSEKHSDDDIVIIVHTSGSTSGIPKCVPYTYRFMDAAVAKAALTCVPGPTRTRDVNSWLGSACQAANLTFVLSTIYYGGCTMAQTHKSPSASEWKCMITLGGLTRATLFPTVLSRVIQYCAKNAELLELMRTLDSIMFAGAAMPPEELEWAKESGLKLMNLYGSTECGTPMLLSDRSGDGKPEHLCLARLLKSDGTPLVRYRFDPVACSDLYHGEELKELVVLADSEDLPVRSFLQDDGTFHTGDIFEEVAPGEFVHRGRQDDFIKMAYGQKCDAGAIENIARNVCNGLFTDCVVIGSDRPSPVLVAEADMKSDSVEMDLKQDIYQRISESEAHRRLYPHEQIASPDSVIVVRNGSLPRTATKGNIRRKAVGISMKETLDKIFSETRG
ncbi:hypothetical protein V5O48_002488 [Marasmius crinis-equi]|uniref:AMP-dependent synthetase/ligase domain-containing protein n=1 Tax=Marasmius crinis-equi TaxID=585013 RepID=A0ABR3FVF7_9AGAR